jgi:ankyrin repeat protein
MSLLLAAGADGCIADKYLKTPLHYVSKVDDPRMVDLLFLYNKDTNKVIISQMALEPKDRDLGAIAREVMSEDEEEVIGMKGWHGEEEDDQDLEFVRNDNMRLDQVYKEMQEFGVLVGDEKDRESVELADQKFLLNFRDKLGRTALHYSCYYGNLGVVEDLIFLKANTWIEDAYTKRPIDLLQKGSNYDVLVELLTNNMKISKNPLKNIFKLSIENNMNKSTKTKKKLLKSLDLKDLQLTPDRRLVEERIGITFDNYLAFAIRNNNFEATKYLLKTGLFDIDFMNSSGFTYFHLCIVDHSFDILKLLFLDSELVNEPYDSRDEVLGDIYQNINPEIFKKRIFELTSNKQNTILNWCVESGTLEIFQFLLKIFIDHYTQPDKFESAKKIIDIEDKNGHSVIFKCVLKDKNDMLKCILEHKEIIKQRDLDSIAKYT